LDDMIRISPLRDLAVSVGTEGELLLTVEYVDEDGADAEVSIDLPDPVLELLLGAIERARVQADETRGSTKRSLQ
jgi:hypothetical protein